MKNDKTMNILVAEDDIDDRLLITKAFKESFDKANLICVENGEILLSYLRREGKYKDQDKYPAPNLILLDLNMPKKDGREALVEIKSDENFKTIPVIIFTTSQLEDDIKATYTSGTNSYITKPGTFDGLLSVGKELQTYWGKTVLLPN
ncbi:response regulator [Belliella sp. R4-6]|uniref:Response regulator n=1 Tax=Belliella alkalica TaxID=1730871 RepID=A0ABS9V7T6_9BACT|nr:response regulator [Belliella alkalica]MCH7412482.1 response regulator [Belliella alkalica]